MKGKRMKKGSWWVDKWNMDNVKISWDVPVKMLYDDNGFPQMDAEDKGSRASCPRSLPAVTPP
eukprot:CAMPEP_0113587522 /NCGR_PEP_ID=MMETSP0015_2-20120614/34954_1 /TAXON_ID=2838 /ORGANISM="Odontella" /LENGTH=62 /DNA_ID=CAMNT_0000493189 /DNA_START=36 /DNA_END=221 /DNA_ORIENTATION=+ /assembly_acc=CAM_ASM_000160